MKTTLIRSRRKTLSVEARADGVVVRAPLKMSQAQIAEFLQKHSKWIETHVRQAQEREAAPVEREPKSSHRRR